MTRSWRPDGPGAFQAPDGVRQVHDRTGRLWTRGTPRWTANGSHWIRWRVLVAEHGPVTDATRPAPRNHPRHRRGHHNVSTTTRDTEHQPAPCYWAADSEHCPHGPEPDGTVDPAGWDAWHDRHPVSDSDVCGPVCLDAPVGECCSECTADNGDFIAWADCRIRNHTRPKHGITPTPDARHEPVIVLVGTIECLDRECDDYFDDDGNEKPGLEHCPHIREDVACSCQRGGDGEYSDQPCTAAQEAPRQ